MQQAHEVLTDKEKRDIYDKYGEEGLKEGGAHASGMDDILGSFFGMGGRGRRDEGPKQAKPIQHPIKLTLEEIYSGKTTKIAVNRDRICKTCEGRGGKDGAVQKCGQCRGKGMVTKM